MEKLTAHRVQFIRRQLVMYQPAIRHLGLDKSAVRRSLEISGMERNALVTLLRTITASVRREATRRRRTNKMGGQ